MDVAPLQRSVGDEGGGELVRRHAGQAPDLPSEVGLVEVAEVERQLGPALAPPRAQPRPHGLEAQDARRDLRGQADLLPEMGDQTLAAPAQLRSEPNDGYPAAAGLQPPPRPLHARRTRRTTPEDRP